MPSFGINRSPRLIWLLCVALLIGADQYTKSYFSRTIPLGSAIEISNWFNLVHVLNTGAAFSLLADAGGWQRYFFIAIAAFIVVVISLTSLMRKADPFERKVGAFIVAGGGGNLVDRIQSGAVIDFLDVHLRGFHWPAFNLADVYVVIAVLAWLLLSTGGFIQKKFMGQAPETGV